MSETVPPQVARTLATWHDIIATGDVARLPSILADDVVFRSPAFFKPYPGKEATVLVLSTVIKVFENFVYYRTFHTSDGSSAILEFGANIASKSLKGIDMFRFDADGLIAELEVMVRPGNALMLLGQTMAERAGPALLALLADSR